MKAARGFTLVEVLVALAVMAVMAGMAWQGVDGIVRARDASQGRLEQSLRLDSVVAQWEQDLAAIQDAAVVPASLALDGSTVRLTRRVDGGLQVVGWALRPDGEGASWWRWAGRAATTVGELQEDWIRSQQLQGGEPGALRAVRGVDGWHVYFYYGNAWSNCQSTGNLQTPTVVPAGIPASGAASAVLRPVLPSGVRMVLDFAPGSGQTGSLTRDVLVGP